MKSKTIEHTGELPPVQPQDFTFVITICRNRNGITLIVTIPTEDLREAVTNNVRTTYPDARIEWWGPTVVSVAIDGDMPEIENTLHAIVTPEPEQDDDFSFDNEVELVKDCYAKVIPEHYSQVLVVHILFRMHLLALQGYLAEQPLFFWVTQ